MPRKQKAETEVKPESPKQSSLATAIYWILFLSIPCGLIFGNNTPEDERGLLLLLAFVAIVWTTQRGFKMLTELGPGSSANLRSFVTGAVVGAILTFAAVHLFNSQPRFVFVSAGESAYKMNPKTGETWLLYGVAEKKVGSTQ